LRGSDNQRLVTLTVLGRKRFADYERRADARERAVDVMFDDNGEVWLAGIPARDDFRRLKRLLLEAGAIVAISQGRRDSTSNGAMSE
jgi:anaerobic ribonucleoside-triphosphate reductase activating protein